MIVVIDVGVNGMLGLFHWMLRETLNTPGGIVTLHVSEYEVPATPDSSPDILTNTGASTTEIGFAGKHKYKSLAIHSPGVTGPATGLGRSTKATREILWTPPTGRPVSSCLLSLSRLSMVKATL